MVNGTTEDDMQSANDVVDNVTLRDQLNTRDALPEREGTLRIGLEWNMTEKGLSTTVVSTKEGLITHGGNREYISNIQQTANSLRNAQMLIVLYTVVMNIFGTRE